MESKKQKSAKEKEESAGIQTALGNDSEQEENQELTVRSVPGTGGTGGNRPVFNSHTIQGNEDEGILEIKKDAEAD